MLADQDDGDIGGTRRLDRSGDDGLRGMITAHGVEHNCQAEFSLARYPYPTTVGTIILLGNVQTNSVRVPEQAYRCHLCPIDSP